MDKCAIIVASYLDINPYLEGRAVSAKEDTFTETSTKLIRL
jgi:hypothetical protein